MNRSRDAHDIRELAFMLNNMHSKAKQLRVMADDIENAASMIRTRMESIAKDIIGIGGAR